MGRHTLHATVEWKAGHSPGELEGYASIFGNVDLVGDVVMPGAFRKTITDWRNSTQPMPLIADHELSTSGVVGSIADLREDTRGLKFKAMFSSTSKAQELRTNILEGHIKGTSFTYDAVQTRPGRVNGKAVRELHELRLFEITVSPFPINQLASITSAKATDAPWDGSASRFSAEQWRRSCLIDTGEGDTDSKERYSLPVREPGGALNANGVHAAAARIGQVKVSADKKRAAARTLIRLYGEIGDDPPDSLRMLAGMGSSSFNDWLESMRHAIGIPNEAARKAAVETLVACFDEPDPLVADSQDAAVTTSDAATSDGDTSTPDDAYAVSFLQGPSDGTPDSEPPNPALPASLADLEHQRSVTQIDELEADIQSALGGDNG
jgi:HK97 family phage prohead protease